MCRAVRFMDFNGPRSYLDRVPKDIVRILDALGDRHPDGRIILTRHGLEASRKFGNLDPGA